MGSSRVSIGDQTRSCRGQRAGIQMPPNLGVPLRTVALTLLSACRYERRFNRPRCRTRDIFNRPQGSAYSEATLAHERAE